ncbi:hypothetical protein Acr_17g0003130 [Actinidia rufa]|uniref:Uncharacterized protein n=1 Tax=Actinidia rufa TaxID=165716 RepID=A0A7J0G1T1_9ERIC|nr:hypothetical protein Acr_17g0003130 [Actinidia rufa]
MVTSTAHYLRLIGRISLYHFHYDGTHSPSPNQEREEQICMIWWYLGFWEELRLVVERDGGAGAVVPSRDERVGVMKRSGYE